ncbi:hypothetical protein [Pseudomonas putida]|uniref:hypothetical protein n=1 Tax=Pseudomonas putida TaxID=303 RepID=UPI0039066D33
MSGYDYMKHLAVTWANEAQRLGSDLIKDKVCSASRTRTALDEHFFLTSITMLNRTCSYLAKKSPNQMEVKAAKEFFALSADAIDVRNKREHLDEYIDGKDKKQSQFTVSDEYSTVDLTATVVDENGYHLGNKATVEELILACDTLLRTIKSPW